MQELNDIKNKIFSMTGDGEILLIVPPFGSIDDIALGPHILQALAQKNGYKADILYLNILLASIIGTESYKNICFAPQFWMLGERLFARKAYGLPVLGKQAASCTDESVSIGINRNKQHAKMFYESSHHFNIDEYFEKEQLCSSFIDEVISTVSCLNYKIVGCTAMTGQIACSAALFEGIKKKSPEMITIIGGSNCEDEMAEGIASLSNAIDFIFSGESDSAFLNFLSSYSNRALPSQRIIQGELCHNLDCLPLPDYSIFFRQYAYFLEGNSLKNLKIWNESSRGCRWGQKSKCAFCGVTNITYRKKTTKKIINDLKKYSLLYPENALFMADSMMPPSFLRELFPVIAKEKMSVSLGYQVRADLDINDLIDLKNANIKTVFPGIESFSTPLLKLMNKGITGRQTLQFLRNARSVGLYCDWFLLWGFPGDSISNYVDILNILPLIRHLQPPRKFEPVLLTRFSPYLNDQKKYKISKVRIWPVFETIYPDWADKEKLALFYTGQYPCESYEYPEIISKIFDEIVFWRKIWKKSRLVMLYFMDNYLIYDSREINENEKKYIVDFQQAKEIMTFQIYMESENLKWAVEKQLGVLVDSWYIPLITASPELLSVLN